MWRKQTMGDTWVIREKDILRVSVLKGVWYYCTNRQIDQ